MTSISTAPEFLSRRAVPSRVTPFRCLCFGLIGLLLCFGDVSPAHAETRAPDRVRAAGVNPDVAPYTGPSPVQLLAICTARGPVALIENLRRRDGVEWDAVLGQISRGDPAWLELVPCLSAGVGLGADAALPPSLHMALAQALPENPVGVLELEERGVSLKHVCAMPFAEPEPEFLRLYVERTFRALSSVRAERLAIDRRVCEMRLRAGLKR